MGADAIASTSCTGVTSDDDAGGGGGGEDDAGGGVGDGDNKATAEGVCPIATAIVGVVVVAVFAGVGDGFGEEVGRRLPSLSSGLGESPTLDSDPP
mmetsp:Transcript_15727/g.31456  ORF Transcript_15727/g.31456 Transcript_15727/m.31456 type:complete len:96 (-) Transcript_15727:42-329(-)